MFSALGYLTSVGLPDRFRIRRYGPAEWILCSAVFVAHPPSSGRVNILSNSTRCTYLWWVVAVGRRDERESQDGRNHYDEFAHEFLCV